MFDQKYPTSAFYFRVHFVDQKLYGIDPRNIHAKTFHKLSGITLSQALGMSFHEVTGMTTEMTTEDFTEGGENRFVHHLPTGIKQGKLILKKGIGSINSELVEWCKKTLEGGLVNPIEVRQLQISLLNGQHEPENAWDIINAFPVAWEIEEFKSTKNEIAIEKIELHYNELKRSR